MLKALLVHRAAMNVSQDKTHMQLILLLQGLLLNESGSLGRQLDYSEAKKVEHYFCPARHAQKEELMRAMLVLIQQGNKSNRHSSSQ
jgi:hypothetical protein